MNAPQKMNSAFQDDRTNFVSRPADVSVFHANNAKTRVPYPQSDWVSKLATRLNELAALPRGWNGYSGQPASATCVSFAINLIESLYIPKVPAPQLVTSGDGTIQIEWHRNQIDLEIVVHGPYEVSAMRRDIVAGATQELDFETDYSELTNWVRGLITTQLLDEQLGAA